MSPVANGGSSGSLDYRTSNQRKGNSIQSPSQGSGPRPRLQYLQSEESSTGLGQEGGGPPPRTCTREPVNKTISDVIEQYKKKQLKTLKSARTRETHLEWWDNRIGSLKLYEVLPAHVSVCLRGLEEPGENGNVRSPGTINRYHSSIGAVFNAHKTLHWMPSNPSRDVQRGEESKGRVGPRAGSMTRSVLRSSRAAWKVGGADFIPWFCWLWLQGLGKVNC